MTDVGLALLFDDYAPSVARPLNGAEILDDIARFIRRYIVLSEAQTVAVTLWAAHTYVFRAGIYTPYLAVTSATKRCGKSRLAEVLSYFVNCPWTTSSVSAAVLYREIDSNRPTLLLDEVDALFQADKETAQAIRGVLNSGNHYKGTVSRLVGKGTEMVTKNFHCYCPKLVAGIGTLPDTVADRSLHIRLNRKPAEVKVERLRERKVRPESEPIRVRLEEWADSIFDQIKQAEPSIPDELNDRQQDGAEILLALADLAGGDWPTKARQALVDLCTSHVAQDDDYRTQLLTDIKLVFEQGQTESISCKNLVEALKGIETSPWSEWRGGKGLTPQGLGRLLDAFDIKARQIWIGPEKKNIRHYCLDDFQPKFSVYLPSIPLTPLQGGQPVETLADSRIRDTATKAVARGTGNSEIANKNAGSSDGSGIKPENTVPSGKGTTQQASGANGRAPGNGNERTLHSCGKCGGFCLYKGECETCGAAQ